MDKYSLKLLEIDRKIQTRFVLWKFEDELKKTYEKFVQSLEVLFFIIYNNRFLILLDLLEL